MEFKPVWFISIMGTGISASTLYNFPYAAQWLRDLSYIMFFFCSFSLLASTILFGLSLTNCENRTKALEDLNFNVFLGCYAMGFTSWINMVHFLSKGSSPITLYVLWWISNLFSLFTAWFVFFKVLKESKFKFEQMTPTVLLPIVALTVTSSSGQIICPSLPENLKLSTIIIAFFLWANAMGMTFVVATIYFHRLLSHKLPPKPAIFTSFILIGPFGQGSLAIQLFGSNINTYLSQSPNATDLMKMQGVAFQASGLLSGLFLQAMGLFLTFFAVSSVVSYGFHKFHYGMWAMTFPLGTMCLAAKQTYVSTAWTFFRVMSAIYGVALVVITSACIIGSLVLMVKSFLNFKKEEEKSKNETKAETESSSETTTV